MSPRALSETNDSQQRKLRARARRTEGGAVIFVTAMTIAVLASLGLYALSTARAEVRSSGYETRMTMTDSVAQWAFGAEVAHLNLDPGDVMRALDSVGASSSYDSSKKFNNCIALDNVPSTEAQLTKNCISNPMPSYTTGAGALNIWTPATRAYNATPDFFVELTNADDPPQLVKGLDLNGQNKYKMVTVTTYAILHLTNQGTGGTGLQTTSDIVRQGRGHLIAGPINNK